MPSCRHHGLWLTLFACSLCAASSENAIVLKNVTDRSGVTFQHRDGSSGRHYIIENVASGLALFDYDNDGDEDIYFLNGGAIKGTDFKVPPRNALYRNEGDGTFAAVGVEAGVADAGWGRSWADAH